MKYYQSLIALSIMEKIISSIRNEALMLEVLFNGLDELTWKAETSFKSWSPEIILSHLLYFDRMTIYSLNDLDKFNEEATFLFKTFSSETNSLTRAQIVKDRLLIDSRSSMIAEWKASNQEMTNIFFNVEPDQRCQWFGPDMSARMFMVARYMETWSHSQAIYELLDERGPDHQKEFHVSAVVDDQVFDPGWGKSKKEAEQMAAYLALVALGEIEESNVPE